MKSEQAQTIRSEIESLRSEKRRLEAEGIQKGWITSYGVQRRNKNGKIRTYEYYHYCVWEMKYKKVVKKHIRKKELKFYEEEYERYKEYQEIQKRIRDLSKKLERLKVTNATHVTYR
jgi:hypothetical protein